MWYSIIAGLGIGLLGSFHCIGMCGPIALSLPVYGKSTSEKLLLIVLYNIGRASTYAFLGVLFGFIGNQFFLFGYQQIFSVAVGLLLLAFLLVSKHNVIKISFFNSFFNGFKVRLAKLLQSANSTSSYFVIGVANGLLPCGLVYLAIGSATATGSVWSASALMFLFGLGTFPLMISLMIFGKFIPLNWRNRVQKLVPIFVSLTAVVIILRGLNLDIPYLSPRLEQKIDTVPTIQCHK